MSKGQSNPRPEFCWPVLLIPWFSLSRDLRSWGSPSGSPQLQRAVSSSATSCSEIFPLANPPQACFHLSSICSKQKMHHRKWEWGLGGSQLYQGKEWVGHVAGFLSSVTRPSLWSGSESHGGQAGLYIWCWEPTGHTLPVSSRLCYPTGCEGKQVSSFYRHPSGLFK